MSGLTHDRDLSNTMNGTTIVYLLISSVKISDLAVDKPLIARSYFGLLLSYDVFICSVICFLLNTYLFPFGSCKVKSICVFYVQIKQEHKDMIVYFPYLNYDLHGKLLPVLLLKVVGRYTARFNIVTDCTKIHDFPKLNW